MVSIITTSVTAQAVTSTDPILVAQAGVVSGATGISFGAGSDPGVAIISGTVTGSFAGISTDGADHVTIAAGGFVGGLEGAGAEGLRVSGVGDDIVVQGTVRAVDAGVLGLGSASFELTVADGGLVQGGSNGFGDDSGAFSAAVGILGTAGATIRNVGAILADFNPDNDRTIAILNASVADGDPSGFDPSLESETKVANTGVIFGDVVLGAGDDVFRNGDGGQVFGVVDMGEGEDIYASRGGGYVDGLVSLGSGDDIGRGGADNDEINGDDGADALSGGGGEDELSGGDGRDLLRGGMGDDELFGNQGRDTLDGRRDDDMLTGGGGADRFVFVGQFGVDTVTDFSDRNREKLDLSRIGSIRDFNDLVDNHLSQNGADAEIDAGGGRVVILQDFLAADLDQGDFIL